MGSRSHIVGAHLVIFFCEQINAVAGCAQISGHQPQVEKRVKGIQPISLLQDSVADHKGGFILAN